MLTLNVGEVHIWFAWSRVGPEEIAPFDRVLSPSERAAADRFVFARHRLTYRFAHTALRNILSNYVASEPETLRFAQNSFGKPFLTDPDPKASEIQFNMSHSGEVVVVAVTRGRHIGVDIEMMRPLKDYSAIANLNFTSEERAWIECSPVELQQNAFFSCWARKEAVIKAVGKGLSMPLNTFDASILSGQKSRRLSRLADAPDVESWSLTDLTAPEGYAGAVAVEQSIERLMYSVWEPV
jgi:4'-phosphopantetheinyl transferase